MKITAEKIVAVTVAVLVAGAVLSTFLVRKKYNIVTDIEEVKKEAELLYESGDIDGAILKLSAYCEYAITDTEAAAMLGDWYMEQGEEESAVKQYYNAAYNKKAEEADIKPLSVKNEGVIILKPITNIRFEISPDVRMTKDMTISVTNANLKPEKSMTGKVDGKNEDLSDESNFLTTDWFPVSADGEYLTMSGGFNCAVWQFKNSDDEIITSAESTNRYRIASSYAAKNYQMARVVIPDEAAACRVTYFDFQKADLTAENDETISIVYGRLPGESKASKSVTYTIPDLKDGEKIVYENSSWKKVSENGEEILSDWEIPEIERGSYITLSGTLPGRVDFTGSEFSQHKKDGIYTISFDMSSSSAVGERLDDAKNLGFKAAVGTSFLSIGESDFDEIYPWSEMKLCNISGENITYEGEYGYSTNGSGGDVFVEIPKFYSKRTVEDGVETISITGEPHEGFEVDEAFKTKDGEADKIYIAAYLSSVDENGCARSVSGEVPKLLSSAAEISAAAKKNGSEFYEMDYAALFALQKLFLVETGIRNSQYLYMGECALSVVSTDVPESTKAKTSSRNSNIITISNKTSFKEGDSVIIFSAKDSAKSIEDAVSDIRTVKTVIDNGDNTYSIYFSGDAMNITEGVSAIAHVAAENGKTGGQTYHTASESTARGTTSFRYRNIENIWGNAYVFVDKVTVKNSQITIEGRDGTKKNISYSLPSSEQTDNVISYEKSMIKSMGYDSKNPSVMLPDAIGDGATSSTYYGDLLYSENSDRECVLYYGGSWYIQEAAGLFSYNTLWGKNDTHIEAAGRMMVVK
jgi:hypothetical protein